MTDNAMNLWSRLLSQGNAISVYDTSLHQYVLTHIKSVEQMQSYFGDISNQKYTFVLSENNEIAQGIRHSIALMELKRKSGYPLEALFEEYRKHQ